MANTTILHVKYISLYYRDYGLYNFLLMFGLYQQKCHFTQTGSTSCFNNHFSLFWQWQTITDLTCILFSSLPWGAKSSVWHQVGTQRHLLNMQLIRQPATSMPVLLRQIPQHSFNCTGNGKIFCNMQSRRAICWHREYSRFNRIIVGTNLVPFPRI